MRSLGSFQGVHSRGKIVVCGCGVSLKDFERPGRFVTIGVNDVGRLFQPNYLLVVDRPARFKGDRFHYVETSQAEYLFTQLTDLGVPHPNIVNFRLGTKDGVDFSNPDVLHYNVVTPYMALYLAAHMGAADIGLIGVDFTDHHFFADTGPHEWTPHVANIDEQFYRLGTALVQRGIRVFNLSCVSRLTAFPKMDLQTFAGLPAPPGDPPLSLRVVSYATTPEAGVPAILARCINARTRCYSRCLWSGGDSGTGIACDGDIDWNQSPARAMAELEAADVVVVHSGQVAEQHSRVLEGKTVITEPGSIVPTPIPLWEEAFQPGTKDDIVTICYTPSAPYHQAPPVTMGILEKLAALYPVRLLVVRDRPVPHSEALAMKRRAHILIDECVTGSSHRNCLEGLAAGCVVVNGVGLLPGVEESSNPFTHASLETLEEVLRGLLERGPQELAAQGASNRLWLERHWDFALQWERSWQPVIEQARHIRAVEAKRRTSSSRSQAASVSVVMVSLNEGEYLRRTIDSLAASLPDQGEIIVVDDGSADGSADFLKTGYDSVTALRSDQRLGSARARNFGAQQARGKVIVFCDAHVAVPPDWAGPLLSALNHPDVGAVMPAVRVMRYPDDYLAPDGIAPTGNKAARGYGLRWRDAALSVEWLHCKGSEPYAVPLLGVAFLAMRRNLFAAIGGFDSGLLTWGAEDAELSLRLWTLGYECLVVPGVEVAHLFRRERPYRVEWEAVLYNKLRLAAIHFGPERKQRVIDRLKPNGGFPAALARLESSDTEARRSQLHSFRRYEDDWFFEKFRSEVTDELADIY